MPAKPVRRPRTNNGAPKRRRSPVKNKPEVKEMTGVEKKLASVDNGTQDNETKVKPEVSTEAHVKEQ